MENLSKVIEQVVRQIISTSNFKLDAPLKIVVYSVPCQDRAEIMVELVSLFRILNIYHYIEPWGLRYEFFVGMEELQMLKCNGIPPAIRFQVNNILRAFNKHIYEAENELRLGKKQILGVDWTGQLTEIEEIDPFQRWVEKTRNEQAQKVANERE